MHSCLCMLYYLLTSLWWRPSVLDAVQATVEINKILLSLLGPPLFVVVIYIWGKHICPIFVHSLILCAF